MMTKRLLGAAALGLLATLLPACTDDPVGPETAVEAELNFLRAAPDAPALEEDSVSFWAVRGEDSEIFMHYQPRPGDSRGEEFLRFRLREGSIFQRLDGTPIAMGDSIEITIVAVDPSRLIVELRPSGLRFAPGEPARLKLRYAEADHDFDNDGDQDEDDARIERTFFIWRQERPGDPWVRIGTARQEELDEVEADLTGFTRYAIAF